MHDGFSSFILNIINVMFRSHKTQNLTALEIFRLYFPFGVVLPSLVYMRIMWKFWWNILCFQLLIERLRWRLQSKSIGKKGITATTLSSLPNASYIIRNCTGIRRNLWIYNQKSRLWTHCHLIGQMNLMDIIYPRSHFMAMHIPPDSQFTLDFMSNERWTESTLSGAPIISVIFCFRICRMKSASWCYAFPFGAH